VGSEPELLHVSEDPGIVRFEPRPPGPAWPDDPPAVWAIERRSAAHYFFPRDCPRVCFWALPESDPAEVAHLVGPTAAPEVIAIEGGWLDRVRACRLYAYRLPPETFVLRDAAAGYRDTWSQALDDACETIAALAPDVVVVSLGVDTFERDPISRFKLVTADYPRIGARIAKLGRPTLFVMEGGYAVEEIGVNAVGVLTGFEEG